MRLRGLSRAHPEYHIIELIASDTKRVFRNRAASARVFYHHPKGYSPWGSYAKPIPWCAKKAAFCQEHVTTCHRPAGGALLVYNLHSRREVSLRINKEIAELEQEC